jgi:hypothetical protein
MFFQGGFDFMKRFPKRRRGVAAVAGLAAVLAASLVATLAASGSAAIRADQCAEPTITGTTQDGQVLTAHPGQCNFSGPYNYDYQWQRCGAGGNDCNGINNADHQSYKLRSDDVGHTIRVRVTAKRGSHSDGATSNETSVVAAKGASGAPKNQSPPTISGTPQQGETLTVSPGNWGGSTPINFSYRWQRCDTNGGSCSNIIGANGQHYKLASVDVGNTLRNEVTAKNGNGTATATTAPTAVIRQKGSSGNPNAVQIGDVSLPNRLLITGVQYSPSPLRSRDPFTARFRVTESQHSLPVQGAQVRVIGIPYRRIAPAGVVTTDGQGFATFTLQPTALMPLIRGAVIVVYVQATKPGQSVIGGVSATRLTQVRISP